MSDLELRQLKNKLNKSLHLNDCMHSKLKKQQILLDEKIIAFHRNEKIISVKYNELKEDVYNLDCMVANLMIIVQKKTDDIS